jgi:secreted Zn-dependent insulinase-like peptidase
MRIVLTVIFFMLKKWRNCGRNDKLKLPVKNEFIPSVFDLKKSRDKQVIPTIYQLISFLRLRILHIN